MADQNYNSFENYTDKQIDKIKNSIHEKDYMSAIEYAMDLVKALIWNLPKPIQEIKKDGE